MTGDEPERDDPLPTFAHVALIVFALIFAIAFVIAAIGEVNAINDARKAAGRFSDAGIDVYMRAIGHSAALAVVSAVLFVGSAIVGRLDD